MFNPSNIGLVVAFLVLGSERVEPLDFWWAPLGAAMVAAYAVIFVGGLWICGRLRLLGISLALWLSLAAGIGVLGSTGSHHHDPVVVHPNQRVALLVDRDDLAGDLHLPVLHDHRSQDGAERPRRSGRVRRLLGVLARC